MAGNKKGRSHERVALNAEVTFRYQDNTLQGRCENISLGGLFIQTPDIVEKDSEIQLELLLPDYSHKITVKAISRWTTEYDSAEMIMPGMGLEFAEIQPETQNLLEEFVIEALSIGETSEK